MWANKYNEGLEKKITDHHKNQNQNQNKDFGKIINEHKKLKIKEMVENRNLQYKFMKMSGRLAVMKVLSPQAQFGHQMDVTIFNF